MTNWYSHYPKGHLIDVFSIIGKLQAMLVFKDSFLKQAIYSYVIA